jgi:crotonobetainyl-CoA:carnitine CoA-transferase CaiB-like acyl-CoA transferase
VAASFASFSHLRVNGAAPVGFAPLSGFRRTADGWVRLHANYPHHERALLEVLEVTKPEAVDDALHERLSIEVENEVTARGGLAVAVRSPEQWAASKPGRALIDEPWVRIQTSPTATPTRAVAASLLGGDGGVLEGLRVLDLTRVIAGPSASRILGALGADVLRVDPPAIPELPEQYVDTGFSKRSAVADLNEPDTLRRLRSLLPTTDIFLTAYRGGSLARYGLDTASLRADYPGLAMVSLDAWGDRGPWAERRGFDSVVQAATGISHIYGTGEGSQRRPGALPVQALDHATGLGMAAVAVALVSARVRGLSGSAHLSLARTATELLQLPGPPPGTEQLVLDPPLRSGKSYYGELTFVPPPLMIDNQQLEYGWTPQRYGSTSLEWR